MAYSSRVPSVIATLLRVSGTRQRQRGSQATAIGGVAVSPAGPNAGDIYVADADENSIRVISLATNKAIGTISLGAIDVAFGPGGAVYANDTFLFVFS